MTKTTIAILVAMGLPAVTAAQAPQCMYAERFFSSGSVSCQSGREFRCVEGAWKSVGVECADDGAGVKVPGVNEPPVRSPSVKEPGIKQPGVAQPPAP